MEEVKPGRLRPKNWDRFQHYKKRRPPWIKLYRDLLDDFDFHQLPVASRALAPLLWLMASEETDGWFDGSTSKMAYRFRMTVEEAEAALSPLVERGFFIRSEDASAMLATCLHDAIPETEERERQRRGEKPVDNSSKSKPENPWWKTEQGIQAKGIELGIPPDRGESWHTYKGRLFEHINGLNARKQHYKRP